MISGRKPEKLAAVAAEITEHGGRATCFAFDIRDEEAVRSHVDQKRHADDGPLGCGPRRHPQFDANRRV